MPTTPLEILCLAATKTAVQDLNTNSDKLIADPSFGEAWDLAVGNVIPIVSPSGQRAFNPQSWSGWTSVRVSLGNGPIPPVAGVWYLLSNRPLTSGTLTTSKRYKIIAFVSGDDFTNVGAASNATGVVFTASGTTPTTWTHSSELQEITIDLDFDATAAQVQTALNGTAFITSDGGVAVTQDTFYFVLWNDAGDRAQLTGFAGELAPLSIVEVATVDDGSTITELQIVRVIQNAASFVDLTTDSDPASISVDELQAGGMGANAKYRAILDPQPYDGGFTITIQGIESAPIAFDASAADFQSALENISINHGALVSGAKYKIVSFVTGDDFTNVGALSNATGVVFTASGTTPTTWTNLSVLSPVAAGNVFVNKEADGQYFFVFQGDMADTDMGTITGDSTGLQVTPYKLGVLNFDTPGCALLLGGAQSVETFISVTAVPPGDSYPRELFRRGVTLNQGINYPGYSAPQPNDLFLTETQSDARYLRQDASTDVKSGNTLTIDTGAVFKLGNHAYLIPTFSTGEDLFRLAFEADGIETQQIVNRPLITSVSCRDPRLLYINGVYYTVFTTGTFGATDHFEFWSSTDLINWTHVASPSVASIGSVTQTFGPCPLMYETGLPITSDGNIHVLVAVSTDGGTTFGLYEMHASIDSLSSWSSPSLISGDWGTGVYVTADNWIFYQGAYYLLANRVITAVSREVQYTCATMTGSYTATNGTTAFAGLTGVEGASLVFNGTNWRAAADDFGHSLSAGGGIAYTLSSGSSWSGWSSLAIAPGSSAYRGHRMSNSGCWFTKDAKVIQDIINARNSLGGFYDYGYHRGLGIGDVDSYFGSANTNTATPQAPLSVIGAQGNIGGQLFLSSGPDGSYCSIIFGTGATDLTFTKRFSIDVSNDTSPNGFMQSYDFQNSKLTWKFLNGNQYLPSGGLFIQGVGSTLSIASGSNAKAGTFTLVGGSATVSNTSVTANSVILVTLKTSGGTRTGNPDIVPTASTGFVATGGVLDTSTYNYVIVEVA